MYRGLIEDLGGLGPRAAFQSNVAPAVSQHVLLFADTAERMLALPRLALVGWAILSRFKSGHRHPFLLPSFQRLAVAVVLDKCQWVFDFHD